MRHRLSVVAALLVAANAPAQQSFEHPRALPANQPIEWRIPLRDHDHVFLKGHRLMVQVQSTWFPLIDATSRNSCRASIRRPRPTT